MGREPTRLLVVDDLYEMPDDGYRYELVRGHLIAEPRPGCLHGRIVAAVASALEQHVRPNRIGIVVAGDPGFILARDPDTVRGPDVAVLTRARYDQLKDPAKATPGSPDLAVEVVSPSDRMPALRAKVPDYLDAGSELVWVVEPASQRITVYDRWGTTSVLQTDDLLRGGSLLPDFKIRVGELFEY